MIWLLLAACTGPADSGKPDDTATDSGDDTNVGVCTVSAVADLFVDPPTTVRVSWDRPLTDAVVRFGDDESYGRFVTASDPQSANVPFLGAGAEWHFRVEGQDGAVACASDDVTARIPPAPAELPALIETIPWEGALDAPLLVTTVQGGASAVVVVDREGRYAWWRMAPSQRGYARARLSSDGSGVWALLEDYTHTGPAELVLEPWTGPAEQRIEVLSGHHDFAELNVDGDQIAWLVSETREVDGELVVGDLIRVRGDDGVERDVWNAFEEFTVEPNVGWEESTIPGTAEWTHANTLRYLPDQDAFLVSLHFVPAVVLVGRDGALRWVFGGGPGIASDFDFGAQPLPDQMHSPSLTDAGLLMFENGSTDRRDSRVVEFAVDWDARTAEAMWEVAPSEDAYAYILGDAVRDDAGATLTTWGNLGLVEEFAADGTPTWKVNLGMGDIFGFLDTLAAPWTLDAQ